MENDFYSLSKKSFYLFIFIFIFSSSMIYSQEIERVVIQLKNGEEYIGDHAFQDSLKNTVVLSTIENGIKRFLVRDIKSIKSYQQVMKAPEAFKLPYGIDTCRLHLPILFELKALGMKGKEFYYGAEAVLGFRIVDRLSIGAGTGWWNIDDVSRFPIFIQFKYNFFSTCLSPFLVMQAGTILDRYTSKYNIKPSIKHVKERGPKMASVGIGIDYALFKWLDLSADLGARYITILGDVEAASCDGPTPVVGYKEIYAAYFKIGIAF